MRFCSSFQTFSPRWLIKIVYLISDKNGSKTILFGAAHTVYVAYVGEGGVGWGGGSFVCDDFKIKHNVSGDKHA